MKKFFFILISIILLVLIFLIFILCTSGIETNKFNNFISKKINQSNNSVNLKLNTIKFKLDIKETSLFIDASKPQIYYRDTIIPAKEIKVYIDFISLIKSDIKIKKINLILEELDINQLKNLSTAIKPSNFRSLINNKIKEGKIISELEFFLDNKNLLKNFIAKGTVSNLKAEITDSINLEKTSFNFFADKTDILIKNFFGKLDHIKIMDGDLKFELSPKISLDSSFKTNLKYNDNSFINFNKSIKDFSYVQDIKNLEAELNNTLLISFDETFKVKKYKYGNRGKILKANFDFKKPISNFLLKEKIKKLSLVNAKIETSFNSKKNSATISGKYSINNGDFLMFDLKNVINEDLLNLNVEIAYNNEIKLDLINYQKPKNSIANFSLNLEKKKENIKIKKINLTEKNNLIAIEDLEFNNNKFSSLKKILVKTAKNGKINNDFSVLYGKKIRIAGTQFDASNLPKFFKQKQNDSKLTKINKEVEIDFTNIIAPLSENLKNFKLIGEIEKGKFSKISAKGDFGSTNFLDISLKNDKNTKKKYLEIYSDLTKPLLTEYSFFKGLTGGKLLYSAIIDKEISNSKLKIENFKLINAPGMVKLLSLADLGGLADLAEGEGLSFDVLEIKMEDGQNILKLNEILALGPSVSILMEGYQEKNGLTSLRGTLVPAKNLNKLISKIPLIGKIIIPKEVGEGLFGISFKMKGLPGKLKTTLNPIRTLTPRFIQKIIDRNKSK